MQSRAKKRQRIDQAKAKLRDLQLPKSTKERLLAPLTQQKKGLFCCVTGDASDELLAGHNRVPLAQRIEWFVDLIGLLQADNTPTVAPFTFICDVTSKYHRAKNIEVRVREGSLYFLYAQVPLRNYVLSKEKGKLQLSSLFTSQSEITFQLGQVERVYQQLRQHHLNSEAVLLKGQLPKPKIIYQKSEEEHGKSTGSQSGRQQRFKSSGLRLSELQLREEPKLPAPQAPPELDTSAFFTSMFPDVSLATLQSELGFKVLQRTATSSILRSQGSYKLVCYCSWQLQDLFRQMSEPPFYFRYVNTETQELSLALSNDNSCIIKETGRIQRMLFEPSYQLYYFRHCFTKQGQYFIYDKSIAALTTNASYYPQAETLWQFKRQGKTSKMIVQVQIQGLGSSSQTDSFVRQRLRGLAELHSLTPQQGYSNIFRFDIAPEDIALQKSVIEDYVKLDCSGEYMPMSQHGQKAVVSRPPPEQIGLKKHQRREQYIFRDDENGFPIYNQSYLHKQWQLDCSSVIKNESSLLSRGKYKFWHIDEEEGWMIFTDEDLMERQRKVFGYLLKSIGSNIITMQPLTRISLPVTIFQKISFLERVAKTFQAAPQILDPIADQQDKVKRFKRVVIYGLSMMMCFLVMEKPFNPILGQTYQGQIGGFKYFAEQISHHPPITSYYMVGRGGIKQYGTLEHRSSLGVNSACGVNVGDNTVEFSDGTKIVLTTVAGQVSGILIGNRKLKPTGSTFFYDRGNKLFTEIKFADRGGLFSRSSGKIGSFSGELVELKEAPADYKKIKISQATVHQYHGKFTGEISSKFYFQGKQQFDIMNDKVSEVVGEDLPLPSDPLYRGDVFYLSKEDGAEAQVKKEVLENIQRKDRKLRQEHGPKKPKH